MEWLWESPWRAVPAIELMLTGAALTALGARSGWRWKRMAFGAPGRNLQLIRSMRFALGGASLAAIGAGWLWHLPVLIAAGAVIGFEETIETSIAASALADEPRRDTEAGRG